MNMFQSDHVAAGTHACRADTRVDALASEQVRTQRPKRPNVSHGRLAE